MAERRPARRRTAGRAALSADPRERQNDLGSIDEGKLADLVVLDRDYFTVSDADMRRTRPVLTVVDGEIVYDAGVVQGTNEPLRTR